MEFPKELSKIKFSAACDKVFGRRYGYQNLPPNGFTEKEFTKFKQGNWEDLAEERIDFYFTVLNLSRCDKSLEDHTKYFIDIKTPPTRLTPKQVKEAKRSFFQLREEQENGKS